jgi:hypothetical protein
MLREVEKDRSGVVLAVDQKLEVGRVLAGGGFWPWTLVRNWTPGRSMPILRVWRRPRVAWLKSYSASISPFGSSMICVA